MSAAAEMRGLVNGYRISQAIHVAAVLGLSDRLAAGPRTVDELAAGAGCDPPALFRLLRALATVGVYAEDADGRFRSTELGDTLRSGAPDPVGNWAAFVGGPLHWQTWGSLLHSIRTGQNAFRAIHGQSIWEYRAAHPDENAVFDAAMTDMSEAVVRAVLAAYDFSRFGTVVDVGGGRGALLAGILARNPGQRGVLFDQPHVVAGAEPTLRAAGVADRCTVEGGDFFRAVPEGGDAYVMKSVLHDWDDERSVAILRSCRRVMSPGSRVLLVERLLASDADPVGTAFGDLNMMVGPGGQERSEAEYHALFVAAELRPGRTVATGGPVAVIEATV